MTRTVVLLLRHLVAIAILPCTVVGLVPLWIARQYDITLRAGETPVEIALQYAGIFALVAGALLFASSVWKFATDGRGTLAPWDPPRMLVIRGPYRLVRNPMISGVAFALFGEALVWLSVPHAAWAVLFLALNVVYIPMFEEPRLARRFGQAYEVYRRNVPRFLPRAEPWRLR
jgi:protein-S-isoprenylcysteine O-methyltransferase Ste14